MFIFFGIFLNNKSNKKMESTEELTFEIDELWELMQRLSEEKRQVLTLRLRGYTIDDIVEELNFPADYIKKVIKSGVADLHKMRQVVHQV